MRGASAAEIAADLRRQIAAGVFVPGDRLPSVRELRATHHVAKATVHSATKMLHAEGLIVTQPGVGCFVRDAVARVWLIRRSVHESRRGVGERTPLRTLMGADDADEWFADVVTEIDVVEAGQDVASELGIEEREPVLRRMRTMTDDGVPVAVVSAFFPRSVSRGTTIEEKDTGEGGIHARLLELGLSIERHVERVASGPADDAEMMRLGMSGDQPHPPVLRIDRLTLGEGGRALGTVHITALADRFELVYDIPDEP